MMWKSPQQAGHLHQIGCKQFPMMAVNILIIVSLINDRNDNYNSCWSQQVVFGDLINVAVGEVG